MSGTSNVSYALRTLRKSPGFTAAVVVSLALGIGANAAIFSVVNGLLFHPAGVSHPEELIAPRVTYKKLNLDKIGMSSTDFADVRDSRQVFSKAALLDIDAFNYTGGDSPQRLAGALVTSQWFEVFGVSPLLGRGFHAEDDSPGANKVAVLSFETWHSLFGADPGILGRTLELNTTPYRVIGVMPADFRWPSQAAIWVPIGLPPQEYGPTNRFNESYFAVARLAPGISPARAAGFMQVLSNRVLDQVPYARASQWSMVIEPLTEYAAGNLKRPTFILLGAVGLVLLIACSNIAGLMLVRGTSRARELAIRTALGANRADLIKNALVETFLLSLGGTVLGFGAAFGILRILLSLAHAQLSSNISIHIDGYVLAFTVLAGVLSALLFGLAPAWHISRLGEHYDQLKEGGRSESEGHHRQALRSTLVAAQIALALVLLVGAGLLLKTLANLHNVNAGFDPKNVMTTSVALPAQRYSDEPKQISFLNAVQERLSQSPGVLSAAIGSTVPFAGDDPTASFGIEGRILPPGDPGFHGSIRAVSPDYFKTLRISLLQGRTFTDGDRKDAQPVAIIDDNLARRYWPNENPIGKRLKHNSQDPWATIVGIVGHVKQSSLAADSGRGAYYFSIYQQPVTDSFLIARGNLASAQLSEIIRNAVRAIDPGQAIFDLKTMDERIALSLGPQRFAVRLLAAFAAVGLFLAIVGLYAVISYSVTLRTREIGIRSALGAERANILLLIIQQ
ncbi:MAG: ABC transporter permease, partial [Acidobacteriaceae bacterium]|nr:ABC transporter permease [Acidobacteriaceae bacterium]